MECLIGQSYNTESKALRNPYRNCPLLHIVIERFVDYFQLCLRFVHPKVVANGDMKPNALRLQALSTLATFVTNYYDYLEPSMRRICKTIDQCLDVCEI